MTIGRDKIKTGEKAYRLAGSGKRAERGDAKLALARNSVAFILSVDGMDDMKLFNFIF